MAYQFTVSPDFSPEHLSGWYIFNTWLQKQIGAAIHLEMYGSFQNLRDVISQDRIDLIYANPFDAAMLVREKGFLPLVKVFGSSDEAIVAVNVDKGTSNIEQLPAGIKIACTDDPDVRMMGMMTLEAADLSAENSDTMICNSYVLVAKQLLQDKADIGFFLAKAYDDLSNIVKNKLIILVRTEISVIHHCLMMGPNLIHRREEIQNLLINMASDDKGRDVLKNLGIEVWAKVEDEDMEFMIDLMDTLAV